MTRLYFYIALVGAAILGLLTFGASQRRAERRDIDDENRAANEAAEERIESAIRPNDTAGAARDRLRERNARNK